MPLPNNMLTNIVSILLNTQCRLIFASLMYASMPFNSLRPRLNGRPFADDIFKWIFLNENEWISPRISLKFVPKGPINNNPALVQIMAWRRTGDKPLSEPMMVSLPTHICVTRPQWDKRNMFYSALKMAIAIMYVQYVCTIYQRSFSMYG